MKIKIKNLKSKSLPKEESIFRGSPNSLSRPKNKCKNLSKKAKAKDRPEAPDLMNIQADLIPL